MFSKFIANVKGAASAAVGGHPQVGQVVNVENYNVTIQKPLAEGGFAVVFLAADAHGKNYALKKILCSESESEAQIKTEIDVMRKLQGSEYIVKLYAAEKKMNGKFCEFWLLMELCTGGHVVDLMNTRLSNPFSEKEAAKIFIDVCRGLEKMHSQSPPIAHRDIKPENVLRQDGRYKLCDFGSATTVHGTPGVEFSVNDVEDDILKNTTLNYRAPEQVDFYQNRRISEKVDVWAMGVFLYKIMYFQDAFEESNLAILGARYKIPQKPAYSDDIKSLIRCLLEIEPDKRYNIQQAIVHAERIASGKISGSQSNKELSSRPAKPSRPPNVPQSSSWSAFDNSGAPTSSSGGSWADFGAAPGTPPPSNPAESSGNWAAFSDNTKQQPSAVSQPRESNPFDAVSATPSPVENPFLDNSSASASVNPFNALTPEHTATATIDQAMKDATLVPRTPTPQTIASPSPNPFMDDASSAIPPPTTTTPTTPKAGRASNPFAKSVERKDANPFQQQEEATKQTANPFVDPSVKGNLGRNPFLKQVSL
eukprot:m.31983 g.31983  ORF g.31983 m.31983 type:complete len:537 (-) comp8368_c0_seq2:54-1664(-)